MLRRSLYLFVIVLAGCGAVAAAPDGGGGQGDAGPTPDAAGPEWILEATDPDSLGSWFHAVGSGTSIYYVREAQDATRFFRHYDLESGQMLDDMNMPDPENDFCACGYGSDPVAHPSGIFYIANYAHVFDFGTLMWQALPYPFENQRGEAAVGVVDDQVVFVGGRGPLNTCQSFDLPSQSWIIDEPPTYPSAVENARGATLNGRMYVLGGRNGASPVTLFTSWTRGEGGWTFHPDIPEQFVDHAVGFRGQIWALFGSEHFRRFDPSTNSWDPTAIHLPSGTDRGIPVVAMDPTTGEDALYYVEAAAAGTRFLRYNR
jgi:hypothetical protein